MKILLVPGDLNKSSDLESKSSIIPVIVVKKDTM